MSRGRFKHLFNNGRLDLETGAVLPNPKRGQISPDTEGRLNGMILTVAGYARESGKIASSRVDAVLRTIDQAQSEGKYLAISPQFVVTAIAV